MKQNPYAGLKKIILAIMPAYLNAPEPSTADNVQYSPMFWNDMFPREIIRLAGKKIKDVRSPPRVPSMRMPT